MQLSEFRLETYDERLILLQALRLLQWSNLGRTWPTEIEALLARLSRTQCQPGGCPNCSDELEPGDLPEDGTDGRE